MGSSGEQRGPVRSMDRRGQGWGRNVGGDTFYALSIYCVSARARHTFTRPFLQEGAVVPQITSHENREGTRQGIPRKWFWKSTCTTGHEGATAGHPPPERMRQFLGFSRFSLFCSAWEVGFP